jgi:hypothetical protein
LEIKQNLSEPGFGGIIWIRMELEMIRSINAYFNFAPPNLTPAFRPGIKNKIGYWLQP